MGETKTYEGGCHCGKVRYSVDADLSGELLSCNCSMCGRAGSLLTFVPVAQFQLKQGEDALTDYQFNTKNIHHLFCSTCGVRSFARGKGPGGAEMVAINARCLEGIDVGQLKIKQIDGASM
jgi:hypothetical protein